MRIIAHFHKFPLKYEYRWHVMHTNIQLKYIAKNVKILQRRLPNTNYLVATACVGSFSTFIRLFFTLNWITIFINFLLFLVFLRQSQRFSFCVSFLYILNYAQKKTTNHLFMNSIYLLLDSCYHIMWRRRLIGFSVH